MLFNLKIEEIRLVWVAGLREQLKIWADPKTISFTENPPGIVCGFPPSPKITALQMGTPFVQERDVPVKRSGRVKGGQFHTQVLQNGKYAANPYEQPEDYFLSPDVESCLYGQKGNQAYKIDRVKKITGSRQFAISPDQRNGSQAPPF